MIGELITGASNILGGLIGAHTTQTAADKAAEIQRETNAMHIDLANTAHQRQVADLKKAGLNPLLSGTGGNGASTPTLQAPTQGAEGSAKAGQMIGNVMAMLPSQILQFMQGQQQIDLMRANADQTRAQTEKTHVETTNEIERGNWINPINAQNLVESKQRVTESTQRTEESVARTATIKAMKDPQVQHVVAQAAQLAQQTKTEEQRTKEATEAAANAKQLYGARAREAATIAAQAATYYEKFFLTSEQQKIDTKDLEIELLRNKNFQQLIQNMLDNEYGHMERWSKIMDNPLKIGATVASEASKGRKVVTTNPYKK